MALAGMCDAQKVRAQRFLESQHSSQCEACSQSELSALAQELTQSEQPKHNSRRCSKSSNLNTTRGRSSLKASNLKHIRGVAQLLAAARWLGLSCWQAGTPCVRASCLGRWNKGVRYKRSETKWERHPLLSPWQRHTDILVPIAVICSVCVLQEPWAAR